MRFEEREQFCGKMQVQGDGDQLSVVSTEQRHGSIGSLGSRSMLGQRPVTEETVFTFQMEYQGIYDSSIGHHMHSSKS